MYIIFVLDSIFDKNIFKFLENYKRLVNGDLRELFIFKFLENYSKRIFEKKKING